MSEIKSGRKTMLMSVIMSSPGPLVVGLGLLVGQSSTQIADFVRRSIELLAIILAFAVYCITTKDGGVDEVKKARYERKSLRRTSAEQDLAKTIMEKTEKKSGGEFSALFGEDESSDR